MSRCISLGNSPEVDEPNTTSGPATRLAVANNCCFNSSRSGALSWTNVAPSNASSNVVTLRSAPPPGLLARRPDPQRPLRRPLHHRQLRVGATRIRHHLADLARCLRVGIEHH